MLSRIYRLYTQYPTKPSVVDSMEDYSMESASLLRARYDTETYGQLDTASLAFCGKRQLSTSPTNVDNHVIHSLTRCTPH